jgi:hypothetical protein
MESKLNDIKIIQEGEFYIDSKIFFVTERCLLLLNQDGTTYKYLGGYPQFNSRFDLAFLLDPNHIILKLEKERATVEIRNLITREIREFHAFNNTGRAVTKGRRVQLTKTPAIIGGKLLVYPLVKFYYDNHTSATWDVETGRKKSSVKEDFFYPSDIQLELPDGRIIKIIGDNELILIEKGKKNKRIQTDIMINEVPIRQIGTSDVVIIYGFRNSKPELKTFKFPLNGEPFPLETYHLLYKTYKLVSINSSEVLLYTENGIMKFNLLTNNYTENFGKVTNCGRIETEVGFFVVENPNKFKILRCLLLVKLKKELPRDLILEVYTFFSSSCA